ncbi:tetratricopeptide repeat protein [Candidatus Nitrospira bockiana]
MSDGYTTADVLRILQISEKTFETCLRAALFPSTKTHRPRRFSFQDLLLLKTAKGLCEAGIPVARIRRVLDSLKRQLPPDEQLSRIRIYADGRRVVVWDASGRWQPDSGQFVLNFEARQVVEPRRLSTRPRRSQRQATAEEWLERGLALESEAPEEARRAYEEALALDPASSAAHLNLGRLFHEAGDLARAELCYRRAVAYAPDEAIGVFNLAVLMEDRGDLPNAIATYEDLVDRWPDFADAHHNLARLYEATGQRAAAIRHYSTARRLSGNGLSRNKKRGRKGREPHP